MNGVDIGAAIVLSLLAAILGVAVYVWVALALAAAFRKMGEDAWRAWVPILNIAVLLRWGGFSPWLALLALIPGLGTLAVWILLVITVHRLNPGFGYGPGMTVVGALLFPVWATIVGFGPAEWRGPRLARVRPVVQPDASYPPIGTPMPDFGAPLPPPPFPAPSDPAPPTPRAGVPAMLPESPASVAPQPWSPEVEAAPASTAPSGESVAAPEAPDPTAPTPTVRSEVSPPVRASGPEIISSVPGRDDAPVTRLRRAAVSPDRDERDVFPELTGEVSAVSGSPAAGAPVSAASSVSAQERRRDEAAGPSFDEALERTVVVQRGRTRWELVLPDASTVPLASDVVVLGRNPVPDASHPRAQVIAVVDATRTVSKTHARLERRGDTWRITDLGSTNGILLPSPLGADVELKPGEEVEVTGRFLLGDAALRLNRMDAGS
ncbi:DUF5684 domain-containing protein [Microbacterium sp. NPDC091382]|uniref:DUF5684 domain-containing protein n=1 Tax=Microbacterium sp. NPDC091382 TaxID=3364210 RepID=UPI00381B81AF